MQWFLILVLLNKDIHILHVKYFKTAFTQKNFTTFYNQIIVQMLIQDIFKLNFGIYHIRPRWWNFHAVCRSPYNDNFFIQNYSCEKKFEILIAFIKSTFKRKCTWIFHKLDFEVLEYAYYITYILLRAYVHLCIRIVYVF